MGHACSILTFKETESKKNIQAECDEWGNYNCDPQERGGCFGGLQSPINFTSLVFEDRDAAEEYLNKTFGKYRQTAVRFKKYPGIEPSAEMKDLERRIGEYQKRIAELDKPHYAGVKQATVKCKTCGSSLATAFCGSSYRNYCPVCRADLRPASTLEKREKYSETLKDLSARLKKAERENERKSKKAPEMYWAVACEVHC